MRMDHEYVAGLMNNHRLDDRSIEKNNGEIIKMWMMYHNIIKKKIVA